MTTTERQQSLAAAHRACEWLDAVIKENKISPHLLADIACLLAEFKRLNENARRPRAGRPRIKTENPKTLAQRRWRDKKK
jgi:hypothetical protein